MWHQGEPCCCVCRVSAATPSDRAHRLAVRRVVGDVRRPIRGRQRYRHEAALVEPAADHTAPRPPLRLRPKALELALERHHAGADERWRVDEPPVRVEEAEEEVVRAEEAGRVVRIGRQGERDGMQRAGFDEADDVVADRYGRERERIPRALARIHRLANQPLRVRRI